MKKLIPLFLTSLKYYQIFFKINRKKEVKIMHFIRFILVFFYLFVFVMCFIVSFEIFRLLSIEVQSVIWNNDMLADCVLGEIYVDGETDEIRMK